jgi:hypothetical protein
LNNYAYYLIEGALVQVVVEDAASGMSQIHATALLSKKRSKKEVTKRPPFLVKSLVCKTSEKTVHGGWKDDRTFEPF